MPETDGPALATARAQLRERFEAQQSALDEYVAAHRKVVKVEESLGELVAKRAAALGRLADRTDAATAARLTGASLHATREALAAWRGVRRDTAADDGD
jgi:hypothetical protein